MKIQHQLLEKKASKCAKNALACDLLLQFFTMMNAALLVGQCLGKDLLITIISLKSK